MKIRSGKIYYPHYSFYDIIMIVIIILTSKVYWAELEFEWGLECVWSACIRNVERISDTQN